MSKLESHLCSLGFRAPAKDGPLAIRLKAGIASQSIILPQPVDIVQDLIRKRRSREKPLQGGPSCYCGGGGGKEKKSGRTTTIIRRLNKGLALDL